jgi:guanylate kinase
MGEQKPQGTLYIVSSASGAGKNTILRRLLAEDDGIEYSVSATTRLPRDGEADGREYYFVSREEFDERIVAGDFVEWAEVHHNLYGTLRRELDRLLGSGKDAILEIDVQGMRKLRAAGVGFVSIFIMAPSLEELERRLRARGTDTPEVIAVRLKNAWAEIAAREEYDHVIVNETVDDAAAEFLDIVRVQRGRVKRPT